MAGEHGSAVPERYRPSEDELLLFVDTASLLVDLGVVDEQQGARKALHSLRSVRR